MRRELQVICLATVSFLFHPSFIPPFPSPVLSSCSDLNRLFSSCSPLSHPFSLSFSPVSSSLFTCCPSLSSPIIFLSFPILCHRDTTKIHQNLGGIATDTTAACVPASCRERFHALLQLIGKHDSYIFCLLFLLNMSACRIRKDLYRARESKMGIFVFQLERYYSH